MSQARETIRLLGLKFRSIDEVGPNAWLGRSEDWVCGPSGCLCSIAKSSKNAKSRIKGAEWMTMPHSARAS